MNWFIIQGQDHLGPFSEEFLRKLFVQGQINNDSLVWQEGMDGPQSYYNLFVAADAPFAPRPKPTVAAPKLPEVKEKIIRPAQEDELPPELPIKKESRPTKIVEEIGEDFEEIEEEFTVQKSSSGILKWLVLTAFIFSATAASMIGVAYFQLHSSWGRPAQMSFSDYERLKTVADSKTAKQFALALAQDKSVIWFAANNFNSGAIQIKLQSIPGRILSDQKITAEAESHFDKRLASFSRFQFQEGIKLVDGYYQVQISASNLKIPWLKSLSPEPTQFNYQQEILITSMPVKNFEKALQDFVKEKTKNDHTFWLELEQKYATLRAITAQIRDSVEEIFLSPGRWREKVQKFENEYKLNFGQFFTNFVISNNESYADLSKQTFSDKVDIIARYNRLSVLAKSVGSSSMEILHELEAFQNVNNADQVTKLKLQSLSKLDIIIQECDQKITEAQGR